MGQDQFEIIQACTSRAVDRAFRVCKLRTGFPPAHPPPAIREVKSGSAVSDKYAHASLSNHPAAQNPKQSFPRPTIPDNPA